MKVYLIRHGKTAGNQEARYVGSTDESILEEERTRLAGIHYPEVDAVYASPRKRCLETTELLYPNHTPVIVNDLAECDFGAFEYKNYKELIGDPDYQAWIDSGGTIGFPGGESREQFQNRTQRAFWRILLDAERKGFGHIAIVAHGGTVMALLERMAAPHKDYYEWHPGNGECYEFDPDSGRSRKLEVNS